MEQPRTREELYEYVRRHGGRDSFVAEQMIRLGFWKSNELPSDPIEEIKQIQDLQLELEKVRAENRKLFNEKALLKELRQRRLAESRQKQKETKAKQLGYQSFIKVTPFYAQFRVILSDQKESNGYTKYGTADNRIGKRPQPVAEIKKNNRQYQAQNSYHKPGKITQNLPLVRMKYTIENTDGKIQPHEDTHGKNNINCYVAQAGIHLEKRRYKRRKTYTN